MTTHIRIVRMAGRDVVHTGRIAIGAAHIPRPSREIGKEAERLQTALLDPRTARPLPPLQRIAGAIWRWC